MSATNTPRKEVLSAVPAASSWEALASRPKSPSSMPAYAPAWRGAASSSPLKRKAEEPSPSLLGISVEMSPKKLRLAGPGFTGNKSPRLEGELAAPLISLTAERAPPPRYKPADDHTIALFEVSSCHIGGFLKRIAERWFLTFLECLRGEWKMVVVVADSSRIRLPKPLNDLPIVLAEGFFDFSATVFTQTTFYQRRPTCGASLGGQKLSESATLGGLLRGTNSGTVWVVTVGHLFFDQQKGKLPTIKDEEALSTVYCPSVGVLRSIKNQNRDSINNGNLPPAAVSRLQKNNAELDDLKEDELKLWLGECIHASLKGVTEASHLKLQDLAVIEIRDERVGENLFDDGVRFFKSGIVGVTGVSRAKVGEKVTVLGMMSGSSPGLVTDWGGAYIVELGGKDGPRFRTRYIDHGTDTIAKGDSGGWVFNQDGMWVGMNVGGSLSSTTDQTDTFSRSVFIEAEDILKWVEEIVGERVEVITEASFSGEGHPAFIC